ncbi:MAG: WD40 repeat domain-containing protein [Gemmataceae bacterium]|nr:WD40 repeat domain-containing protein [Gemmataceae bacterium]
MSRLEAILSVLAASIAISAVGAHEIRELKGHLAPVYAVAFHPKDARLITGSFDGSVRFWNAATGRCENAVRGHGVKVTAVAMAPDGETAAAADVEGMIVRRDDSAAVVQSEGKCVYALAYSPDGRWLAACSEDGCVKIWDGSDNRLCQSFSPNGGALYSLAFSPDGNRVATAGLDGTITIHDHFSGEVLHTLTGHTEAVYSVSFAPDGRSLASGSGDGTIRLWDADTGKETTCLAGHSDAIYHVSFDPTGQRLLSAETSGLVVLWDRNSGEPQHSHRFPCRILCAAFAPDGQHIAAGSDKGPLYLMELPKHLR